ncbi:hypothetical protein ACS86_17710 [Vibrio alginolyticus]|nr:hypothetical protein ACS86_17710 [Vibrio alginolyticus]
MMKKYLVAVLPILILSSNVFAGLSYSEKEALVVEKRKDVKGMTKEEVTAKHIELLEAVKAEPTEQNCNVFDVFDTAAQKEKKIKLMDMEAQNRGMKAMKVCNRIKW